MDDKTKVLTKNGYEDGPEQVEECKAFRMIAARLNYMAQDNPWLQFPAKEVCRNMAKSRASDFIKMKRLFRFLKGAGEIKFLYAWQNKDEACDITVLVDSDCAGNTETRKSTSGGVLKVGKHVIRTWSSTQTTVATSSGEAELIEMHDGATRGVGDADGGDRDELIAAVEDGSHFDRLIGCKVFLWRAGVSARCGTWK